MNIYPSIYRVENALQIQMNSGSAGYVKQIFISSLHKKNLRHRVPDGTHQLLSCLLQYVARNKIKVVKD